MMTSLSALSCIFSCKPIRGFMQYGLLYFNLDGQTLQSFISACCTGNAGAILPTTAKLSGRSLGAAQIQADPFCWLAMLPRWSAANKF